MIQVFHKIFQPAPHLQPYLKEYMLLHFKAGANDLIPVKPFPANTEQCLVFYLQGHVTAIDPTMAAASVYPTISINGSQPSHFNFHISPLFRLLSIQFQPGVLTKFIRSPLTELTGVRIDATALLPPGIQQLHERMVNTNNSEEIVTMIESYLWKRISHLKMDFQPIDAVVRRIATNPAGLSIEKMAANACLSISQFERRFTQMEGITPKLYARINRFYKAYTMKAQLPELDWLSIALQTGYYDYQHLVKDFKQFSLTTPTSLVQAQAASPDGLATWRIKNR